MNEVIFEPPLEAGDLNVISADVGSVTKIPDTAVTSMISGAPGTTSVLIEFDWPDGTEAPAAFVAVTVDL